MAVCCVPGVASAKGDTSEGSGIRREDFALSQHEDVANLFLAVRFDDVPDRIGIGRIMEQGQLMISGKENSREVPPLAQGMCQGSNRI